MSLFGPPNVEKLKAKRDVKALTKALGYRKDTSVQTAAAEALGEVGDARATEPLVAVLRDQHEDTRKAAAEALGTIGDARAVEPLVAALADGDGAVRKTAAAALGTIGDARAVEPLAFALKDKNRTVRKAAAEALGTIGDARAVEPLVAALRDRNGAARKIVSLALERTGWEPGSDDTGAVYWIAKGQLGECVKIGLPAVEPLIAALKDKSVRKAAAEALGAIGDPRAVEPLIAVFEDQREDVRTAAAEALGKIDSPAVEPRGAAFEDQREAVRTAAAEALGKIDTSVVERLIAALKDGDEDEAAAAGEALDALGWEPGSDDTGAAYYWIAKGQVGECVKIGAPAVEPLIHALNLGWVRTRSDTYRRIAAAEALVSLYRSGRLDQGAKERILATWAGSGVRHSDGWEGPTCNSHHADSGIGMSL